MKKKQKQIEIGLVIMVSALWIYAMALACIPTPEPPLAQAKIGRISPPIEFSNEIEGVASYYGYESCTNPGCFMANGEPLDLDRHTVAFWEAPLGTRVLVENPKTKKHIWCEVTDTGNFHLYGRIIDLNTSVKNQLGCGDLCQVVVKWN